MLDCMQCRACRFPQTISVIDFESPITFEASTVVKGFPSAKTDAKIDAVRKQGLKVTIVGRDEIKEFNASVA